VTFNDLFEPLAPNSKAPDVEEGKKQFSGVVATRLILMERWEKYGIGIQVAHSADSARRDAALKGYSPF
jgi:hypothetical protein